MNNTLKIRKAESDDRTMIKNLWRKVITQAFKIEQLDQHINPERELEFKMDQFDRTLPHDDLHFFVAFEGENLIGTIAHGTPPNKGILKRTNNALIDTVELGSLYIDPTKQKKGYGRSLLVYALKDLLDNNVQTVCFDSIYETSKNIWRHMFGEPKYKIKSSSHDFIHMIWVVDVKTSIERIKKL